MPRNVKGGKKYKKGKKGTNDTEQIVKDIYKINGIDQYYGVVVKRLGGLYLAIDLVYKNGQKPFNEDNVTAHIRGRFRKRVFFNPGDLVLLSSRSTNDNKMDTLYRYNFNEVQQLKNEGEIAQKYWNKITTKQIEEQDDELNFDIQFEKKEEKIITEYKSNHDLIPSDSEDELTEDVTF